MTTLQIRDARPEDQETIVRFNQALALESEGKILLTDVITAGVRRALASPLCRYFVCEANGQVVGQTMITYEITDWRDGLIYWIQSVYVDPAWRKAGVFRKLYDHVVALAKAAGDVRAVRLYVEHENQPAIRAYERLGMSRETYVIYETPL